LKNIYTAVIIFFEIQAGKAERTGMNTREEEIIPPSSSQTLYFEIHASKIAKTPARRNEMEAGE